MPPPRAAMRARRSGKAKPKTVYRNPALLKLAKGQACTFLVPGWCLGVSESARETTVACHSNSSKHGKGAGIKAHDWAIAFGCWGCHFFYDQSAVSTEIKSGHFEPALQKTRAVIQGMGKWPEAAERGYQQVYGGAR
ncbi:DUF1364 domain-containing protein [Bordetella avium]|nr:DUF1364 domain-containing protein [Bordetella avium]